MKPVRDEPNLPIPHLVGSRLVTTISGSYRQSPFQSVAPRNGSHRQPAAPGQVWPITELEPPTALPALQMGGMTGRDKHAVSIRQALNK